MVNQALSLGKSQFLNFGVLKSLILYSFWAWVEWKGMGAWSILIIEFLLSNTKVVIKKKNRLFQLDGFICFLFVDALSL